MLPPSGRCRRTAKNAYLECFLKRKIFSAAEGPLPNPWAFWLRRVRDSAQSENASPRVGNCGQMGFRGRRNAAGASSRPWHGRNRASSWPDPAAMCNDRAPPKKAPGREPGARGAECIIAPLAGAKEVSSMPTAPRPLSLSDQQLTAVLSAAAPLAPPDRSAFLVAIANVLRGEEQPLGDGGFRRQQLKDAASTIRQYLHRHATRSHQRQGALQGDRQEQGRATEKPTS